MDIQTLRKMRGTDAKDFSKISAEFEKMANKSSKKVDERVWRIEGDKAGNGSATIRFLRPADDESPSYVRMFFHSFQGPTGKWYIENSRSTLDEDDPVSQLNSTLWNSGVEANKDLVRAQKRKATFTANILVVADPKHPENEGKVFLFKFGKKIFDKIKDKLEPKYDDEVPVNVFSWDKGANFKLRMRKKDGYTNYDESTFLDPSPITEDDEKLLEIVTAQYDLRPIIAPSEFKSYDELKKKLDYVLGTSGNVGSVSDIDLEETKSAPEKKSVEAKQPKSSVPDDDDEEDLSEFLTNLTK